MIKSSVFVLISLSIVFLLYSFINFAYPSKKNRLQQENRPPVVKISSPKNNGLYQWDKPVSYSITVSDPEDGESKFDEIPSNEVFLKVKFLGDTSKVANSVNSDPTGFKEIRGSNCLNCHAFNTKLIGPSFYEINKRYTDTKVNREILEKHIREGSTGVWGKVSMPTHPELTKEETENIVSWIFKNGAEQDVNYYRGTEGSFRMKPPVTSNKNGFLVLTASYIDHGLKDKPKQNLRGQDVIILRTQ